MYNRYLRVTLPRFTSFLSRHKVASCLCALFLFYAYLAIRGPQGLQAWSQKRAEIKQLEQQVAAMRAENDERKLRIQRLESSSSEQEVEIRKQLKLQRPGETTFILPDKNEHAAH